jgi:hypothetical protein
MTSGSLVVGRMLGRCQVNYETGRETLILQVRGFGCGVINPILIKETHVKNSQTLLKEHSLGSEGLNWAVVP